MQSLKRFLKPDWRKLLLLVIFVAIAASGRTQA
jgi:hypothetical protein